MMMVPYPDCETLELPGFQLPMSTDICPEQGLMAELVEQAQQQAEARAAKEATSWNNRTRRQRRELPRRRNTLPRTSFAERVEKLAQDINAGGAVKEMAIAAIG